MRQPDSIRLVRMVRTIGGQRRAVRQPDSIRLVRMVRTIGGQRTAVRQPDSIRLVRMVRTIGSQTWLHAMRAACGIPVNLVYAEVTDPWH